MAAAARIGSRSRSRCRRGRRQPLRYRFDPAGEATEPRSYAFLTAPVAQEITTYEGLREDAASVIIEVDESGEATYTFYTAPRASAITPYEGLRRDAATLHVNAAAADGASSDGLFGTMEAGHLIEWFHAGGCFVRYRVTSVAEADGHAPYREFGVRPETYVFQSCQSGSLPTDETTAAFSAAPELPLAHLGGLSLTTPVIHGIFQLVPAGWNGAPRAGEVSAGPGTSHKNPVYTESPRRRARSCTGAIRSYRRAGGSTAPSAAGSPIPSTATLPST